ncbi:FecCD family ABC transporter permease [Rhodococcus maanshanensis]|uniref:Iron complex transport system permease protein n=1 Tax=Rhodococcus maanshanensis TaxID=183556 RepID=A0A1H7M1C7_9NOCA|nr:iron chelate uptake ABC transporter family permease subunit [Rhodococcus maanshanensis]SEL04902.1 iron complex transport system permease protein [Rhodococcus maanshanensis]
MSLIDDEVELPATVPSRPACRVGPVSLVRRTTMIAITAGLLLAAFLLLCINIGRGDFAISVPTVAEILFGGGTKVERFIVMDLRLPRALTALLTGLALGISGAIAQSILRNPLASPDLLGITAGASAAAVALIVLAGGGSFVGLLAVLGIPIAALIGGIATAVIIYALAWRGGVQGYRVVLIGIGFNAMLIAAIQWMLISADINDVARAQVWLNGSLNGSDWAQVWPVAIGVAVVGTIALISSFTLGALRLGDDNARSLGVRLQTGQATLLLAAVALASIATAAVGPIGFVALCAPQLALRMLRTAGPPILASGLVGAVLVVGSDVIARTILPVELPVGIVTSALGGPFLLYLLVRNNRKVSV